MNRTEAYDFSLFEERNINTAEDIQSAPQEHVQESPKKNVVRIPERQLEKNRRPRIHPLKAMVNAISFAVIFVTMFSIVYSQLKLTELTEEINEATQALEAANAVAVQLEMKSIEEMTAQDIEAFAKESLGLSKVTQNQVVYLNAASKDAGEILIESEKGWLSQLKDKIYSWFA